MRRVRTPVRAVTDTNVVRGGLRSRRRPEYQCLRFVGLGWVVPLATPALFLEHEDVLLRPETLTATGLTRADVDTLLTAIAAVVEPVMVDIDWRPLLPDPDDDDELREQVREVAEQQEISPNQFCTIAIARAVGEARARRFFAQRAGGLSPDEGREQLLGILDEVQ